MSPVVLDWSGGQLPVSFPLNSGKVELRQVFGPEHRNRSLASRVGYPRRATAATRAMWERYCQVLALHKRYTFRNEGFSCLG
jgi:hypothetical protein